MTVPVLLMLLLASYDVVILLRTWLQMQSAAGQIAQIISQYPTLYTSDFTGTFYPVAQSAAGASTLACNNGSMVVTGIDNATGTPTVSWQWTSGTCAASSYAVKGSGSSYTIGLPDGYAPPKSFGAILIELYSTQPAYAFSAGLFRLAGTVVPSMATVSAYAVTVPRTTVLPALQQGNRPP